MLATAELKPTRSHGPRSVAFVPNTDWNETYDGTLTITETTGVRVKRIITEKYLLEEQDAFGFAGRAFLVCKVQSKGDSETQRGIGGIDRVGNVYETHLHANGCWKCSCDAGAAGRFPCLHVLALRELDSNGSI